MLCIEKGRVIDPARGLDHIEDIYIHNSRFVPPPVDKSREMMTIDASGCLVVPGLIDFHTHLNYRHTDFGILPDAMTFPSGVTSAVDSGSSGSSNFEGFYKDIVCTSETTIKSFINIAAMGVSTRCYVENLDPQFYDISRLEYIFERYSENILGLKVRIGKEHSGALGLLPLVRTKEIAQHLKTKICVHVTFPESSYEEILPYFDEGDILCHCFQSKGPHNILDEAGRIRSVVWKAKERGVIFDSAYGNTLHNYNLMEKALSDGFMPDIISTDLTHQAIYIRRPYSLLYVFASFLALGVPFSDILRAMTVIPAKLMKMEGQIGTLAPGAAADVSVFRIQKKKITFEDDFGNHITGNQILVPQMTLKAGRIVFRQAYSIF
jgi:dihydroorotase